MFFCLSLYLAGGIKELATSEKFKRKQIKLNFSDMFLEWFDEYSKNGCAEWKPFKEMYNNFMIENDLEKKEYSQKKFKKGLEIASETFDFLLETRRNRAANNQHENRMCKKPENADIILKF
jgi:hypothetical protein